MYNYNFFNVVRLRYFYFNNAQTYLLVLVLTIEGSITVPPIKHGPGISSGASPSIQGVYGCATHRAPSWCILRNVELLLKKCLFVSDRFPNYAGSARDMFGSPFAVAVLLFMLNNSLTYSSAFLCFFFLCIPSKYCGAMLVINLTMREMEHMISSCSLIFVNSFKQVKCLRSTSDRNNFVCWYKNMHQSDFHTLKTILYSKNVISQEYKKNQFIVWISSKLVNML